MIGFGSVRIIESADMVETLAHPLSTTQVVARVAGGPWPVYPSVDVGLALIRWTLDGKVGHGMAMENSSMAYRTRHGKAAKPR